MGRNRVLIVGLLGGGLLLSAAARADIVTLKNGRVIIAQKIIKSAGKVFVITDKGKETIDEDQIVSIVAGDKLPTEPADGAKAPASAPAATPTALPKESAGSAASAAGKETVVENMEMLYRLGKYDELVAASNGAVPPAAKIKVKLLTAKASCRLGQFAEAEKTFRELSVQGTPLDKAYAKAYADILRAYPDGSYQGSAGLSAVELMQAGNVKESKKSAATQDAGGTLKDEKIFDSALRTYAIQSLKNGEPLMTKLKAAWKPELTAGDFEKSGGGKINLHYETDRKKLLALYDQADAISPGVSASVRKELVRQEAEHIESVLTVLADKIDELSPANKKYRVWVDNGKLTLNARKKWQQQTDQAVFAGRIAQAAVGYLTTLYKQNEADFASKIKEAEAKKAQIDGQISGLLKDRDRKFINE